MPSSDPIQRFQDILDNILRIERFTAGLNRESLCDNEQVLFAVKHALLIISEAATSEICLHSGPASKKSFCNSKKRSGTLVKEPPVLL